MRKKAEIKTYQIILMNQQQKDEYDKQKGLMGEKRLLYKEDNKESQFASDIDEPNIN